MIKSTKVENKILYIENVIQDTDTLEKLIYSTSGAAIQDWSIWMAYNNPEVVWGKAKNIYHSLLQNEKDLESFKNLYIKLPPRETMILYKTEFLFSINSKLFELIFINEYTLFCNNGICVGPPINIILVISYLKE
jgi:hypothetical protein